MGMISIMRGEMINVHKILFCILKGNDVRVLGVDEMVIQKLMLKKYGIGLSTLCK
jgi:hypothetical protein